VKLQEWIKNKGLRVVVIFEGGTRRGRGIIKCIQEATNPRIVSVKALGTPSGSGAHSVVLPALRGCPASCRGDGPVRPQVRGPIGAFDIAPIKCIQEATNPRAVSVKALGTPSDRECTQWYFQQRSHVAALLGRSSCSIEGKGPIGAFHMASIHGTSMSLWLPCQLLRTWSCSMDVSISCNACNKFASC